MNTSRINLQAAALALLLLLPLQAFCYYNPNTGKWLTRDPIEAKVTGPTHHFFESSKLTF